MKNLYLIIAALLCFSTLNAQSDLIISEYVEGWSNNKALEIYNPTSSAIQLSNYRITRYANGEDFPPAPTGANDEIWFIALPSHSLQPYKTYVIVLDQRNPNGSGQTAPVWGQLQDRADVFLCPDYNTSNAMYFNGDDAVALEKTDGTLVDLFARWGAPRPAEVTIGGSTSTARCWNNIAPYMAAEGNPIGITADHTMIRMSDVTDGITVNPTVFNPLGEYDTLSANTFNHLGWHFFDDAPANDSPVFSTDGFEFNVLPTATNSTVVGTVVATDTEGLNFYINEGNFIYDDNDTRYEPFEINKSTGVITVADNAGFTHYTDPLSIDVSVNDGTSEVNTTVVITVGTGVAVEKTYSNNVSIYPNPTSTNNFTVTANSLITNIEVMSVDGRKLYNSTPNSYKALVELNITPGVVFVKSSLENGFTEIQKLIVK